MFPKRPPVMAVRESGSHRELPVVERQYGRFG